MLSLMTLTSIINEAVASSTQVIFEVQVQRNGYSWRDGNVYCSVNPGDSRRESHGLVTVRDIARDYGSRNPIIVYVVVRGRDMRKGDPWRCSFNTGDGNIDRTRSTLTVRGRL